MKQKKIVIIAIAVVAALAILYAVWRITASPTKIAFVNYQAITLGQIGKANGSSFVKVSELPVEEIEKAGKYDMVFVNGMGLRITEEQRKALSDIASSGTPVLTTAATNPQNQIVSVDSVDAVFLQQYLAGGRANYRNMLSYVRRYIDGKKLFADEPGDPVVPAASLMYYPDGNDGLNFNSVAAYEAFLKKSGKWRDNAPHIILTGQMGVADSLVEALERTGNMVYPVNTIQQFIARGHADSVAATTMINMAHGRMGDNVTAYLEENNIVLFSPLNVNRMHDDWMADKMGMSGGFLSQSVVTPEIDGAVRPFTLFAHFEGNDGLPYVDVIPGRLDEFVQTVNNYSALRTKPAKDKKIAIFYFKGPGQNSLVAEGMEVAPSLFNMLRRLKAEGYTVENLPADAAALEQLINENGRNFNTYAAGAKADFVRTHSPEIVGRGDYDSWCAQAMPAEMRSEIDAVDGEFPGHGLSDDNGNVAIARLRFGNIVLIPQPSAGLGDDDFKIVHGTDAAPPHSYVAAYLWARYGFGADALMHFGAHGSLEFTPRKQVALSSRDWSDRLVGSVPHIYIYSTSNVGEAMIAKRRTYAGIINYLTPPFMESNVRGIYKNLADAIASYNKATTPADSAAAAKTVKKFTVELGIHRDLRLDSTASAVYSPDEILRIETFAEELANEKITGPLYVLGTPYSPDRIRSTVEAMTIDPIAYSLHKLNNGKGSISAYRAKAKALAGSNAAVDDGAICRIAGISQADLDSARSIISAMEGSKDMLSRMMVMGAMMPARKSAPLAKISERQAPRKGHCMLPGMSPDKALAMAKKMGASEEAIKKMEAAIKHKGGGAAMAAHGGMAGMTGSRKELGKEEIEFAIAVSEVERALSNITNYRNALAGSSENELNSVVNALAGGFIASTSGGDPVLNPEILPTGRNMYAVNAEETPSAVAWEKGKTLADNTIEMYRKAHGDSLPRKVSYTLWSSEFIETEGATIAQVLYMLGVEPVRDPFGRVTDLRLIPGSELGRSRIDVVVQTSGQLRDLAASRLFLISRAVRMAAAAQDDIYPNYVSEGVVESERVLVENGISPAEARELSKARVFGGVNGNYGSGIQDMVEAGDRWENESEIAATYLNNMGATYGSEEDWEMMREHAFEAALSRTDVVVQPRQSNTWGALSLDHVYEFMGGMNLAVRSVTGKDPDAYLSDYRNRNNVRMQEVKEAIGVESRTTILNPTYIKEKMKGGAGDASQLADVVRNTYGWNVMKPDVIDNELWNDIYDTYISDKHNLGTKEYFKNVNPAAMQEMTAVMLETARKGMWQASETQLAELAELHTDMVEEYGPACSGFVCDNSKLRDFISSKVNPQAADKYRGAVAQVRAEAIVGDDGMVMKREEMNSTDSAINKVSGVAVGVAVVIALAVIALIIRRRKTNR
jgi:cobaltochelatase CobN